MVRWFALLSLVVVNPLHAQTVRPDKLREAVCLPRPAFNFQYDAKLNSDADKVTLEETIAACKADPTNPERHLALSEKYPSEQKDKQLECYGRVVALLEKRVAAGECGGFEMAMLGRALVALDRVEEGQALCRKGVEAAPRDYRPWRELLQVHRLLAQKALGKDGKGFVDWKFGPAGVHVNNMGIGAAEAEKAVTHLKVWNECLTAMRRLAPVTESIVSDRIGSFMEHRMMMAACDAVRGTLTPSNASQFMLHPVIIDELALMGQARKEDLACYALAINFQFALFQMEGAKKTDGLSAEQKRKIVEILTLASKLIDSPNRETAWKAAMMTAVVLEQMVEKSAGEPFYRKALVIAPEKTAAAEMLAWNLVTQGRKKEALDLIEGVHVRTLSMRTGLLTAHFLFDLKHFDRAEAIVSEVAKRHGDDVECQLALAAFCLRRSADAGQLALAKQYLARAEKLLPAIPVHGPSKSAVDGSEEQEKPAPAQKPDVEFNKPSREHCRHSLQFLNAVYLGLTDQPLQAWVELRTLRLQDVNNTRADEALKAFD